MHTIAWRGLIFSVLALLLLPLFAYAQKAPRKGYLEILGEIRKSGKGMEGATMTISSDSGETKTFTTNITGKFVFSLDFGREYTVTVTRPGFVTKSLLISSKVPDDEKGVIFSYKFNVDLFEQVAGVSGDLIPKPVAKIIYYPAYKDFNFDIEYNKVMQAEVKALKSASLDTMKARAGLDPNARLALEAKAKEKAYTDAMAMAEQAYGFMKYEDARAHYLNASAIKPQEKYPVDRIRTIDGILAERAKAEADAKAKAAAEQQRKQAEEKARLEAEAKAAAAIEAKMKDEAERARLEGEMRAKAETEAKVREEERLKKEAEAKALLDAQVAAKAEQLKKDAAARAQLDAEAKAKAAAEAQAATDAEKQKYLASEKIRIEAEMKAKSDSSAKAEADRQQRLAAEKARIEAEMKAKADAEQKQKEAAEKKRLELEAAAKAEAEAKGRAEAAQQQKMADQKARLEAEARAKADSLAIADAEKQKRLEEQRARLQAEAQEKAAADRIKQEAADKARLEAEAKAKAEAETRAKLEAEKQQALAEQRARLEAEAKVRADSLAKIDAAKQKQSEEQKAQLDAEKQAKAEALRVQKEAEEKKRLEEQERNKAEAERLQREQEEKIKKEAEAKILAEQLKSELPAKQQEADRQDSLISLKKLKEDSLNAAISEEINKLNSYTRQTYAITDPVAKLENDVNIAAQEQEVVKKKLDLNAAMKQRFEDEMNVNALRAEIAVMEYKQLHLDEPVDTAAVTKRFAADRTTIEFKVNKNKEEEESLKTMVEEKDHQLQARQQALQAQKDEAAKQEADMKARIEEENRMKQEEEEKARQEAAAKARDEEQQRRDAEYKARQDAEKAKQAGQETVIDHTTSSTLPDGIVEEIVNEAGKVIKKTVVTKSGTQTVYQMVTYSWGGVFYFKNNTSISKSIYDVEVKTYRQQYAPQPGNK